ncbi:hypothetical protein EBU95_07945 [bacterium]|nr:hypothetical protein [bacterium]
MGITLEIQEKLNALLEEAADYAENITRSYQTSERSAENLSRHYSEHVNLLDKITNASKDILDFLTKGSDSGLDRHLREVSETAEVAKNTISSTMSEAGKRFDEGTSTVDRLNRSLRNTTEDTSSVSKNFNTMSKQFRQSGLPDIMKQSRGEPPGADTGGGGGFLSKALKVLAGIVLAAGVMGAIQGFMTGGPMGAVTGFFKGIWDMLKALWPIIEKIGELLLYALGKTLSFLYEGAKAYLELWLNIGSAIAKVAMAIIAFPFNVLDGLIKMAQSGGGGNNEYAEMLEKIRQQFGYLDKTAGGTIKRLAKNMSGELANTGLRVTRIFGNLTKRLEYFFEYTKNLAELSDALFARLDVSGAEALGAFNKALGFTEAGQKAVATRAVATGQDINEINRRIANYAIQMSDTFGVTMKSVTRDVGEMMADFEHFGTLSEKELVEVGIYARKLGIEVKSLGKLIDKFLNFEDAANSAAQLSQAFGMNVDAFKLMSAQNPAEQLEILRKGFFDAGNTIENMNVQQRRLLASQTNLSESELALAFSQKSRGVSYDQIKKKGDAAQKSQLTQAQALEKLADAIERLTKSGSPRQGGFLDMFIQGFLKGIQTTKEFRELMRALLRSLNIVFNAGVRVGRLFVELFPGVKDYFVGLTKIFNPRQIKKSMNEVVKAFKDFFRELSTDPTKAVKKFLDRLQEIFRNTFSIDGPGGRQVFEGIKKFFTAMGYIILSAIKEAILKIGEEIIPTLRRIFLDDDEIFDPIAGTVRNETRSFGATVVKMFRDVFGSPGTRERIIGALKSIGKFLYDGFRRAMLWFISTIPDQAKFVAAILKKVLAALRGEIDDPDSIFGALIRALRKAFETLGPILKDLTKEAVKLLSSAVKNILLDPETWKFLKEVANIIMDTLGEAIKGIWKDVVGPAVREALKGLPFDLGDTIADMAFGERTPADIAAAAAREAAAQKRAQTPEQDDPNWFSQLLRAATREIEGEQPDINRQAQQAGATAGRETQDNYNRGIQQGMQQGAQQGHLDIQKIGQQQSKELNRTMQNAMTSAAVTPATASTAGSALGNEAIREHVSSIRETIKTATDVGKIDQAKAKKSLDKLKEFAENLGPKLGEVQKSFNVAFENLDLAKINETLNSIKTLFASITEIKRAISAIGTQIGLKDLLPVISSLNVLKDFAMSPHLIRIEKEIDGFQPGRKIEKIKELTETVKSLVVQMKEDSVSAINNFVNSEKITKIAEELNAAETAARISGIQNTSNAIIGMVQVLNSTSEELARIQPINIQNHLKNLGANLGLGNTAAYTISNKNFTVTVNVDVHMDAKELQTALLQKGTKIVHTP